MVKKTLSNQGDDVDFVLGISPQKFIPAFVKCETGLFEDPNTWRSISPATKVTVEFKGIDWQAEGKRLIFSGVDLTPEASGKTSTIDVAKVSSMTDMQHAIGTVRCKNGFQT